MFVRNPFCFTDFQAPVKLRTGSLNDLVKYLCKPAKNDLDKVRVIFRWITAQELQSLDDDEEAEKDTPLSYLLKLRKEEGDYSKLFVDMCT